MSQEGEPLGLKNQFFAIRVKETYYLGQPAIVIYISDYTKKIKEKLLQNLRREEQQGYLMRESFTGTVSHELRTPLFSIIFFLAQVIKILSQAPLQVSRVPQALNYCRLMMS